MTDTLKSLCELCLNLRDPKLDFIPEESRRQREIIHRDLAELVIAASNEQAKSVVLLAGSLLEALLYSFIESQAGYIAARRGEFVFNSEHDLSNFVNIFNAWFSELGRIPDLVVAYRNTIHINRELEFDSGICQRAARDLLRQLDALLGSLEGYARV